MGLIERDGDRYWVSDCGDDTVLREIYEQNTYRASPASGYRVLDIGANKGIFTIWAAKRGAKVTSYEPNPSSFEIMKQNAALNGIFLDARNLGIWSYRCTLPFYPCSFSCASSTFLPNIFKPEDLLPSFAVDVIPLDEAIGDEEWDLLKLDVEGAETEIILAAKKLSQAKQLSVEVHYGYDPGRVQAMYDKLDSLFIMLPDKPLCTPAWVRQ